MTDKTLADDIDRVVAQAIDEDVGPGDLTAALVPADENRTGSIVTREPMTLAGRPFVDALFRQLDATVQIDWHFADGERAGAGATLCAVSGRARSLLTGERAALNILQTLSATATTTASFMSRLAGTSCRVLDTRKTIPGLRLAQKYAVRCGGGSNHRTGLFDAILIKENHIAGAGGIDEVVRSARSIHPGISVEIEVESLDELEAAISAGVERILLDNFSLEKLREAVRLNQRSSTPHAELEASGNVSLDTIRDIALTGVDFISVGALTKNIQAVDLSMRFETVG